MRFGESGPLQIAFRIEPFEIDAIVFAGFVAVAEAGLNVDVEVGGTDAGRRKHSADNVPTILPFRWVIGLNDQRAFDDFDHVVEGVINPFD